MQNGRSAKLRRRTVALSNLKSQLQAWKSAKHGGEIRALLSAKNLEALGPEPKQENLLLLRKNKIANCERQIEILEGRMT